MVDLGRMTFFLRGTLLSAAGGLELMDGFDDTHRGCRGSRALIWDVRNVRVAGSGSVWEWSL